MTAECTALNGRRFQLGDAFVMWKCGPIGAPLIDHTLAEFAEGISSWWEVDVVVDDVGWVEDGTFSYFDDGVF